MRAWAMALGMALGMTLLPAVSLAGGGALMPAPAAIRARADFRQTSAFGSPGGFPLPVGVPPMGGAAGRVGSRGLRHGVRPVFPAATVWYGSPLYTTAIDPPEPVVPLAPVVYVSPTVYVTMPPAAPSPLSVAAAPPPPGPTVVEYATGRYELRGDGAGTPYAWIWVPNPPAAPPSAARAGPPAGPALPGPRTQIYRWTDDDGTEVWTNHRDRTSASSSRPPDQSRAEAVHQP